MSTLTRNNRALVQHEGNYPFVESATFADDVKAKGGSYQSGWHFDDNPLWLSGSASNYNIKKEPENATVIVPQLI